MSKTDPQIMADVTTLLERLVTSNVQYERAFVSQSEAFRALRDACNKNNLSAARALRRDFQRRWEATQSARRSLDKLILSLMRVLGGWRSPGRDFVQFRDRAVQNFNSRTQAIEEIGKVDEEQRKFVDEIFR